MTTRQELYDRIRSSSKDEVILEEMMRLGFWPRDRVIPQDPAEDIRRKGELERALRELTAENRRLENPEALKREARKRRLAESRRRRRETKERRLRERAERAQAWRERQAREITYLGREVSKGLNERATETGKLERAGLPVFEDEAALARAMGVTVRDLRFFAFSRTTSSVSHYVRFALPKKSGGLRRISAPMPRLKRAQEWILANVLEKVALHRAAHGFRRGRSIVTNAAPHTGAAVVINLDLKDFFPTVTYRRVKGMFRSLGYSEHLAILLALVCTEPDTDEVTLDGQRYYVARGERRLPQGAPTSPAVTNILCRGMDARLQKGAETFGFTYTRYADDLTLSGPEESLDNVGKMIGRVKHVVQAEGFEIHPDKTRVFRKGRRQEVTGLVVNERVAVPRKALRRFRAVLFQIEKDGPAGKRWGGSSDVLAAIEGYANFVHMVHPDKGAALKAQVASIIARYDRADTGKPVRQRWRPPDARPPREAPGAPSEQAAEAAPAKDPRGLPAETSAPKTPWWRWLVFWK